MTQESTKREPSYAEIKFSDNVTTPLELSSQSVRVQVTVPLARVTTVMKFVNTNNKVLEGELVFPLPEQATVTGYALDVNGHLVDAVPVEKEKAKQVFEEEVRVKGKSAAIVEMVAQSNSFRTRIYPLNPNQERTIKVVYTMPVTVADKSDIVIPFGSPSDKVVTEASIEWHQSSAETLQVALIKNGAEVAVNKEAKSDGSYQIVKLDNTDVDNTVESLTVKSSQTLKDEQVTVEGKYFSARMKVNVPQESSRINSDKIQILWDSSYSRRNKNQRDIELLKKILAEVSPKEIVFTPFSVSIGKQKDFSNIEEAIQHAASIDYDGATDLNNLHNAVDQSASYAIVFTDGLQTIGTDYTPEITFSIPMYIISTTATSNHNLLSNIATKSGGIFLNGAKLNDNKIVEQVGKPVLYFVVADYEEEEFEEVYPNEPVVIDQSGYFTIYGLVKSGGEMAVSFKFGVNIVDTKVFNIEPTGDASSDRVVSLLWAKQKMDSLSVYPDLFKEQLQQLGRDFSIVTPNTSLIVLEDLGQYLKHQIVPPVTLPNVREQYMKQQEAKKQEEEVQRRNKINNVLGAWKQRIQWHKTEFKPVVLQKAKQDKGASLLNTLTSSLSGGLRRSQAPMARSAVQSDSLSRSSQLERRSEAVDKKKKKKESSPSLRRGRVSNEVEINCDEEERGEEIAEQNIPEEVPDTKSITVQKYTSNEQYMVSIKNSADHYKAYIQERKKYEASPGFFLDVADYWFSDLKKPEEALNILTNILELELENAQLLRIVAYRLDQEKFYSVAENAFERVKKMNPEEPQSYRDLALVKEKLGKLPEAVELLNQVIGRKWDSRFDEIEQTAAIELNHILIKDPSLQPCHEEFRYVMDLDLRVSMAWDSDQIDIDLHVTEKCPGGEECYYGHNRTTIGGYVSRDFRQGYGPEEYMLRVAPKGSFEVYARYFANHQQSLTGGTTILLTFFTNYMRPNEKSETVTVRLTTNHSKLHVCTIAV